MAEQRQFTKPSEVKLVDTITVYGGAGSLSPDTGGVKKNISVSTIVTRTNSKNADGSPIYTKQVIRFDNKSSIPQDGNATYVDPNTGLTKNRYRSGTASLDPDVTGQDALVVYDYGDGTGDPVRIGDVIANGSNADGALRLDPTSKATDLEKKNLLGPIIDSQKTQITSVMDEFPQGELDQKALNELGGTGRNDPSVSPDEVSKPLPKNTPEPAGFASGGFRYPLDLDTSKQDTLKITAFERTTRDMDSGTQAKRKLGTPRGTIILPINGQIAADRTNVDYDENSLNFIQGAIASNVFSEISDKNAKKAAEDSPFGDVFEKLNISKEEINAQIGAFAATKALNSLGGGQNFNSIASRLNGTILNPNMELLFKSPSLRSFSFQYLFLPRSRPEANQVMGIIRTLKLNMVPRVKPSFFLGSPNVFQLEYMKGGSQHPFLNKFKVCALRTFDVQYAPLGTYATFPDGVMQAYRVNMQFTELDPVYDEDYNAGPVPITDSGTSPSFSSNSSLIGF